MLDSVPPGDSPLRLSIDLFERLNISGIRYCHWKSNIRLQKSLAGKTDFDILVANDDLDHFITIASQLGFRPMINAPERQSDGLSDYLAMDPSSGELLHIHLHDRLVLGSRTGKNIELPIEPLFWRNLEQSGVVRIPVPDLELVILLLRAVLKSTPSRSEEPSRWFPADIIDEILVLYRRCNETRFSSLVGEAALNLSPQDLLRVAASVADNRLDSNLARLRDGVLSALAPYERRRWRDWLNQWRRIFFNAPWAKKYFLERRKRLSETGICIALIGADGSGKTTHTKALQRWLSWKLICRQEYFGVPKSSRVYRVLERTERKCRKLAKSSAARLLRRQFGLFADLARISRWLWSTRSLVRGARRVARLTQGGAIVICDRYPLVELVKVDFGMDGPRIRREFGSRFAVLAALEERWYRSVHRPDLIVVLRTSVDKLRQRRPALKTETIARKANLVSQLVAGPNIAVVDNDRAYQEVHREIRRRIWQRLSND